MAVRPLVTTGVALLSAGALVAGTPALFVPRDEITIAASATEAPAHKTLTQDQINLLAFSLEGAWGAVKDGYGAQYYTGTSPVAAFVDLKGEQPAEDAADGTKPIYDSLGNQLYNLDTSGNLTPATVADVKNGGSFYYKNENGSASKAVVEDPGNCSATGAVCKDGLSGLLYYASDNLLPFLGPVDNIYFEGGVSAFAYIGASVAASIVDEFDPTQRLQLAKRVDEYFTGGVSLVARSVINDNLPDDAVGAWAKGLNNAYFDGGISGAVSYVIDTVTALTSPPEEAATTEVTEKSAALRLLSAEEETEATTETEPGSVSSPSVPSISKLLSLSTENIESPFKAPSSSLAAKLGIKDLAKTQVADADSSTEDQSAADDAAKGDTETTIPATEVSQSEEAQTPKTPKFELPKLPKLNLPEIKAPQSNIETTKVETAAGTDTSETETEASTPEPPKSETGTAATSKPEKRGSLVRTGLVATPGAGAKTEQKKSAGEKFVEKAAKDLTNAFKPKTKAGAQEHGKAKGETNSGSGNSSSGNGDSGSSSGDSGSGGSDK
ncbi:hypothetical protein [Mycobacterium sp. URHD0025]|uniref:hypothetical protein n=1 Tax=Mycobacterium sp. URHD0025 TaxID=1298864 RepID=UPI000404EF9A|nr:hypothetical protein [Mycobacterium sp. URHD0025]